MKSEISFAAFGIRHSAFGGVGQLDVTYSFGNNGTRTNMDEHGFCLGAVR